MLRICRSLRVPVCLRLEMYRVHWRATISEGLRFLGLPFLMASMNTLASVAVFLSPSWMLDSPWWQVVFYWGLLTKSVRKQMLVLFFYYSILGSLGLGYEVSHVSRKVRTMHFLGPAGESNLTQDDVVRFQRFTRNTLRCLQWTIVSHLIFSLLLLYGSALVSGALEFNRFWFFFWLIFWIVYLPSSYYVPVSMPALLLIVVHYLRLVQKRLEVATKQVITTRYNAARPEPVVTCFRRLVSRYISFNRELTSISHFWSFYLWLYMTIFPSIVVYLMHVATKARHLEWICFGIVASLIFASLLGMIVYFCDSVRRGYHLKGDVHSHLHLESMLHNVTLTDYAFRTMNNQVIGTGTYFSLLAKFAFVYFKLLSNKNFK